MAPTLRDYILSQPDMPALLPAGILVLSDASGLLTL